MSISIDAVSVVKITFVESDRFLNVNKFPANVVAASGIVMVKFSLTSTTIL